MLKTVPDDDDQVQSPPLISDDGDVDRKAGNDGSKVKGEAEDDDAPQVCVIDVRNEEEERESRERMCRICHMGSDQVRSDAGKMVNLGCACKGELGNSHYFCARAWFFQKGNRTCEICGKPAKNIKGIGDTGFRSRAMNTFSLEMSGREDSENRCTMSLCNLLLALVILAFFLPWFFRHGKLS